MRLRVGPFTYQVRWLAGYIEYAGERCLGLCDNEQHALLISDRASPMQQLQVLCHEYMEAWVYHFAGERPSKEDYCDLFGLAMAQLIADFAGEAEPSPDDEPAPPQGGANERDPFTRSLAQLAASLASSTSHAWQGDDAHATSDDTATPTPSLARTARAVSVHNPDREHTTEPEPGSPRPWRVRIFEPGEPS